MPEDAGVLDAGREYAPPGCFRGTPATDLEFFNACTSAAFVSFDNCRVTGGCDGGALAPLVKAPPATPVTSSPIDGGTTVTCYDAVERPNVIFMNGSTNFTPFIRAMTPIVEASGFVLVWQPTNSCTGADSVFNIDPVKRVMKNPTNTSQNFAAFYTNANLPNGTPCLLGNSPRAVSQNSEPVDVGQSDIFATSCPSGTTPYNLYQPGVGDYADVRAYLGPIQSFVFAVPSASTQKAISADAARQIFGAGVPVAPWSDSKQWWVRSATTGTSGILARSMGVPATDLWGVDQRSANNMVDQLKSVSTTAAEATIGLLSADFADKEKANIHTLYFQPQGALTGFLPDLKSFTRDKENVRDGHYPLWGPIHLYARATGGDITSAARAFVTQFSVSQPPIDLLDAIIATGNVPSCAMKVTRDAEMGPLRAYDPPFKCNCYYEKKQNGGTKCQPCAGPAECPAATPSCNLGYCEKQ